MWKVTVMPCSLLKFTDVSEEPAASVSIRPADRGSRHSSSWMHGVRSHEIIILIFIVVSIFNLTVVTEFWASWINSTSHSSTLGFVLLLFTRLYFSLSLLLFFRYLRLSPRRKCDLRSFEISLSVKYYFITDVSGGHSIGLIFMDCLTLVDGTNMFLFFRTVCKKLPFDVA
jgi:hypothetical protein